MTKRNYPLTSDQGETRHLLEILAHPGRFLLVATLMREEDVALSTDGIKMLFPGMDDASWNWIIIKPLREARIIKVDSRGNQSAYYYIHPEASDLVQALLRVLFGSKESEVRNA